MTQEQALAAAWFALAVVFYGAAYFAALGSFMAVWPLWVKIKNWASKEKQKGQQIIVGQVEQITKQTATIESLDKLAKEKQAEFNDKNAKVSVLDQDLAEKINLRDKIAQEILDLEAKMHLINHPEEIDISTLSMNELKAEAKRLSITGYSRMSKEDLIQSIHDARAIAPPTTD